MAKDLQKPGTTGEGNFQIRNFEDLINLNINTLEAIVNEKIDNKKAALIFTGSRTVTGSLKLGLEAMKLGISKIGGVDVNAGIKKLPRK